MDRAGTPRAWLSALLAVLALLGGGHLLAAGAGPAAPGTAPAGVAAGGLRGTPGSAATRQAHPAPQPTAVRSAARAAQGALRGALSAASSSERAVLVGAGSPPGPVLPALPAWLPDLTPGCCPVLLPGQLPRPPDTVPAGSSPHASPGRAPPFSAGT